MLSVLPALWLNYRFLSDIWPKTGTISRHRNCLYERWRRHI